MSKAFFNWYKLCAESVIKQKSMQNILYFVSRTPIPRTQIRKLLVGSSSRSHRAPLLLFIMIYERFKIRAEKNGKIVAKKIRRE